jgi:hypothetical protein
VDEEIAASHMSEVHRYSLVVATLLGLISAVPAASSNVQALILTHRLDRANALTASAPPLDGGTGTRQQSIALPRWLPATATGEVLAAWDAILAGDRTKTAEVLMRADRSGSGFTRSLRDFVQQQQESVDLVPAPRGLAEFEYGRAVDAASRQEWTSSLRFFENAIAYQPASWPAEFVSRYSAVLSRSRPDAMRRIAAEEALVSPSPYARVGTKEQPGWDRPVPMPDGRQLEGFSVRSRTALNRGLPLLVDLFLADSSGTRTRETFRTWNLIANGGIELGGPSRPGEFGWAEVTAGPTFFPATTRTIFREGEPSRVLVSRDSGPGDRGTTARGIRVKPQSMLLWSGWIDSGGGTAVMFLRWHDAHGKVLQFEMPVQGNISGPGRIYAGLVRVPAAATLLSILLANWRSTGEVHWDDLFLAEIGPTAKRLDGHSFR